CKVQSSLALWQSSFLALLKDHPGLDRRTPPSSRLKTAQAQCNLGDAQVTADASKRQARQFKFRRTGKNTRILAPAVERGDRPASSGNGFDNQGHVAYSVRPCPSITTEAGTGNTRMQLNVRDAARMLSVSEKTIYR